MGYRFLGMLVWNGGKWFARRKVGDSSASQRVGFAAGLAVVAAVFAFVLARKNGDEQ